MIDILLLSAILLFFIYEMRQTHYWKKRALRAEEDSQLKEEIYFELQDKYRELKNNDISAIYDELRKDD